MSSSCPPDAIKSCPDGTIEVGGNVRINHIAPTIGANGSKTWEFEWTPADPQPVVGDQ
jgi:hypothetical protein